MKFTKPDTRHQSPSYQIELAVMKRDKLRHLDIKASLYKAYTCSNKDGSDRSLIFSCYKILQNKRIEIQNLNNLL